MRPGVRRASFVLALLLIAGSAFAQEFRNTTWLMSKDQVLASESTHEISETNLGNHQQQVVFKSYVNGFAVTITYLLQNDELLSASYTFRRDMDRTAFVAMEQDIQSKNGAPAFERDDLIGWRLARTEIALAHLKDGTTYVAYWEKTYFARLNNLTGAGR